MKSFRIALLCVLTGTSISLMARFIFLQRELDVQSTQINSLESQIKDLHVQANKASYQTREVRKDVDDFRTNLQVTRDRTECLRDTFDVMIGVWPGRAKAPEICGAWPAWKSFGEYTDNQRSIKSRR